jgi:hypothetical protein
LKLTLSEQYFSNVDGPAERVSVGALEAKTGSHHAASSTVLVPPAEPKTVGWSLPEVLVLLHALSDKENATAESSKN